VNDSDPMLTWARDMRALSRQQIALRAGVFLSPLGVMVACDEAASGSPAALLVAVVVGLAAATAAVPDSNLALLEIAVLGGYWSAAVDDPDTPWALVAALLLLAFHTATAAAAMAPAPTRLDEATGRRWARHAGLVALGTAAMWVLVAAAVADDSQAQVAPVVAALALIAGLAFVLLRQSRA
jgi:hypothetical protein